jgi:hypothetical protein
MTENLQRTEQVLTEAELREMLDDEDDKTEEDGRWRFWQNPSWSDDD